MVLVFGWDGGIRTPECRDQNPVPYHLATSHRPSVQACLVLSVGKSFDIALRFSSQNFKIVDFKILV